MLGTYVVLVYKHLLLSVYSETIYIQVDILISKNQVLQILYLKHRVYNETTRIRNLQNVQKFDLK